MLKKMLPEKNVRDITFALSSYKNRPLLRNSVFVFAVSLITVCMSKLLICMQSCESKQASVTMTLSLPVAVVNLNIHHYPFVSTRQLGVLITTADMTGR